MNSLEEKEAVKLAAPGAGLPAMELFLARAGFWMARNLMSREAALKKFLAEAERMAAIVDGLEVAKAAEPKLIKRVVGIEDSSRNWSVFMTLEHLVIVDSAIIRILERLTAGLSVPGVVSTASAKPERIDDPEVVERFRETVQQYANVLGKLPSLRTQVKHAHPWFGELDAHGWHCLAATHHGIHRRQIERIVEGLGG